MTGDAPLGGRRVGTLLMTIVGALLYLAGTLGMAYVAGFSAVWHQVAHARPAWIAASFLGVALSWLGYYLAFLGIEQVPCGPEMSQRERVATVAVGFGSFFLKGGAVVDQFAMKRAGASDRVAKVRSSTLKALEHVPIAIGTCLASIFLLALGRTDPPPLDFAWPWAVCPAVGGAIAVTLAARSRKSLRKAKGFKQALGVGLDAIWSLREMAVGDKSRGLPFFGMTLFWAADIFALWAALQAFSARISVAGIILGYAVGYVVTRRSAPLGGAGLIDLTLPVCLWTCGASLPVAVAAVAVYRFFSLWIPLPAACALLSTVRDICITPTEEREQAVA